MSNIKLKTPSGGSVQVTPTDTASDYTVTLPATTGTIALTSAIPTGIVTLTDIQTLTNKTLTTPAISTPVMSGVFHVAGAGGISTNEALGTGALTSNTTGYQNTAVGGQTLNSNSVGYYNTAVGYQALRDNTGSSNTAVGKDSLLRNTSGANNTSLGQEALAYNSGGVSNVAVGLQAAYANTVGNFNTAVGMQTLDSNVGGSNNTAIGKGALTGLTSGNNNTAVGASAGDGVVSGTGNTILGANVTGLASGLTNNIILANGTGTIKAQHDGTNWTLTGNVTATGTMSGTDTVTLTGTQTLTNKTLTAPVLANPSYSGATANGGTVTTIDINGGTIDGTVIGGTTPAAVSATTLSASGAVTAQNGVTFGASGVSNGTAVFKRSSDGLTVGTIAVDSANSQFDVSTAYSYLQLSTDTGEKGLFGPTGLAVTGALSTTTYAKLGDTYDLRWGDGSTFIAGNSSTDIIQFATAGAERVRIDASGNLGLGVTPTTAAVGAARSLHIGEYTVFGQKSDGAFHCGQNYYEYTSNGYKYSTSFYATRYEQQSGQHVWYTAPSGTAGNAITFTQSLAVGLGTTLALEGATSATGTGIAFPATQVASSNANTLDDYEEGTWTPTQGAGLTVVGTFSSSGSYTKVGRLVTVEFTVTGSTSLAINSDQLLTSNLPFTAGGTSSVGGLRNANNSIAQGVQISSTSVYITGPNIAATPILTASATYFV